MSESDVRRIVPVILLASLIPAALVSGWDWVMLLTGWYRHPLKAEYAVIAIPVLVVGLVISLALTAKRGLRFRGQLLAGVVMTIVAGFIIAANAWFITAFVRPSYFVDQREILVYRLRKRGLNEAEINSAIASHPPDRPIIHAQTMLEGASLIGLVTCTLASGFIRSRL